MLVAKSQAEAIHEGGKRDSYREFYGESYLGIVPNVIAYFVLVKIVILLVFVIVIRVLFIRVVRRPETVLLTVAENTQADFC